MRKTLNNAIKEYTINFVTSKLENCQLFTRVFGKDFARESLYSNLKNVYTNQIDDEFLGYYAYEFKNITICAANGDGGLLTTEAVKKSPKLQSTVLHEGIHAVLANR